MTKLLKQRRNIQDKITPSRKTLKERDRLKAELNKREATVARLEREFDAIERERSQTHAQNHELRKNVNALQNECKRQGKIFIHDTN